MVDDSKKEKEKVIRNFRRKNGNLLLKKSLIKFWCAKFCSNSAPGLRLCFVL